MICAGFLDTLCRKSWEGSPLGREQGSLTRQTTMQSYPVSVLATEFTAHNRLKADFVKGCNWRKLCDYAIARTIYYIR